MTVWDRLRAEDDALSVIRWSLSVAATSAHRPGANIESCNRAGELWGIINAEESDDDPRIHPCQMCEGGTTFAICDECWKSITRDPIRATPARENKMSEFTERRTVLKDGAVIGWAFKTVPEDQQAPSGNFKQVPDGYGEYSKLWMRVLFDLAPWEQLKVTGALAENQLFAEFWGPEIPIRATSAMTRRQARAKEQARRESIDDTTAIEVFELPAKFLEFYTETGLGTRAIIAHMPSGAQVRLTKGSLGAPHDNYDAKPGLVVKGHPKVFTGYQSKLLREIDETDNLDLANVKDTNGNNVLDADGAPIPITWMPSIAPLWIAVRSEIQKAAA